MITLPHEFVQPAFDKETAEDPETLAIRKSRKKIFISSHSRFALLSVEDGTTNSVQVSLSLSSPLRRRQKLGLQIFINLTTNSYTGTYAAGSKNEQKEMLSNNNRKKKLKIKLCS
ncbi:group 2 hemoglobin yjbI [Corchorus capsularis]|uniref:Group 2 hemoglobin yjbI n=1 Tax=Corchorus capsularis TaxID=210143 RepID=A0A1R3IMX6_COCAP|nr:group 2 hemoglobin yjbI [Corchorus capsularis]